MTTRDIQRRLRQLGYSPGPIDGIRGRLTARAVRAFQRDHGLAVDGIVGPNTRAALQAADPAEPPTVNAPDSDVGAAPWLELAGHLLGTEETPGAASNPAILRWADELDLRYASDDIPWCGLFVGHCIAATLPDEPLPDNVLLSRAWQAFGRQTAPRPGAILVFWRGSRRGWQGHVGFHAGETADHYVVRGGNQSDRVSDMRIAKRRLLDARWPVTSPELTPANFPHAGSAERLPVSHNEA